MERLNELPAMILFDYGHTLLYEPDWDPVRGDRELLRYAVRNPKNCTVDDIRREAVTVFAEIENVQKTMDYDISGIVGDRLVYDHLGIEFSLSPTERENVFWTAASPGVRMPDVGVMLDWLNVHGVRTGVISNNLFSGAALRDRLDRLLPENRFEFVLSSADYMIRKPDPRLFEIALIKADLPPERVWYCGDNYAADVVGSHRAGIFPVWYEDRSVERSPSNPEHTEGGEDLPCLAVGSWTEFIEILENLTQKRD